MSQNIGPSRPSSTTNPTMVTPMMSREFNQGESKRLKRFVFFGGALLVVSAVCAVIALSFLIGDAWIEKRIDQINDQNRRRGRQDQDKHNSLNNVEVAVDNALV